jgi:hypothetical protein
MNTELEGKFARLLDGQQVRMEIAYDDSYASVRRIDGEWQAMIGVCEVSKLTLTPPNSEIDAAGTSAARIPT